MNEKFYKENILRSVKIKGTVAALIADASALTKADTDPEAGSKRARLNEEITRACAA
jgi:hypothetical protein